MAGGRLIGEIRSKRLLIVLLLGISRFSGAEWRTEEIAPIQIGPFTSGSVDGRKPGLYAAAAGNTHDGRVFELVRGSVGWTAELIHSAPAQVEEIRVGSFCGPRSSIFLSARNSAIVQLAPVRDTWSADVLRPGISDNTLAGWMIRRLARIHVVTLLGGTTAPVRVYPDWAVEELRCRDLDWGSNEKDYLDIRLAADLRGDGRRRYYGIMSGAVFELLPSGDRWSPTILSPPKTFGMGLFISGDLRGEGKASLYGSCGVIVCELRWNGNGFERASLGSLKGIPSGIAMGDFRRDGKARLYVSAGPYVYEYSFTDSGWREDRADLRLGMINTFGSGRAAGLDADGLFLSIQNRSGFYRMRWEEGERIVIADFRHDGLPAAESAAFAEMLRTHVIQGGNCDVLERERIESILAEQKLQATGFVTLESAVRVGRLMNAKRVVVGTIGTLFNSRVATVRTVLTETGEIERTNFGQWRGAPELALAAGRLSQGICPTDTKSAQSP